MDGGVLLTVQRVKLGWRWEHTRFFDTGFVLPQAVPGGSPLCGCGSGEDAGEEGPAASVVDASATCGALQGLSHRRGRLGQAGVGTAWGEGL